VQLALALQTSAPLHALPSLHDVPAATGVCVTPPAGSHASVVQGLLSSMATVPVPVHVPAWHVSVAVHALLSLQAVPSAFVGFEQTPVALSHVPALWHWSLATQVTGLPPLHAPAWQVSLCVHALPSLHDVPFGFSGLEHPPVPGSHVPAL
jgi:hypothetical protein